MLLAFFELRRVIQKHLIYLAAWHSQDHGRLRGIIHVEERHFAPKTIEIRDGVEQGEGVGDADLWPGEYLQWRERVEEGGRVKSNSSCRGPERIGGG
jgi:hypothetical protein